MLLMDRMHQALATAQRRGQGGALLFIDLDNFKQLNDTLGHDQGDLLLQQVAQRLNTCVRSVDTVARLGGDEFILVQTGVAEREQATGLASRIVEDLSSYYNINGYTIEIGTSVGIALLSDEQLTPDDLLISADQALYQAKRTRSGYAVYTVAPHLVPSLIDGDDFRDSRDVNRKTANLR